MQLSFEQSGDVRIVRVKEGKLTYPVLSSFLAEVRQIVEDGAHKLVIDLEAVTYIDSASIGCLMDIHRLLKDRNGAVKLSGLQPRVETMLSMTGVHKIVDVHHEEAEAQAAFGRPPKPNGDVPAAIENAGAATAPDPTLARGAATSPDSRPTAHTGLRPRQSRSSGRSSSDPADRGAFRPAGR